MKTTILFTLASLLLLSCGRDDSFIANDKSVVSVKSDQSVDLSPSPNCLFEEIGGNVELTCGQSIILIPGNLLSSSEVTATEVTIKASRKNDGADGSKNYDTSILLSTATKLEIPAIISATGDSGDAKILYIKFNNDIDCAWFSDSSDKYQSPRCYTGATRDPTLTSGFDGGLEYTDSTIDDVLEIEMHIDSSLGNGVITTATAIFTISI